MTSPKIQFLMLSTGYVESQSLGSMLIKHVKGFDTAEEAIVDFSEALKSFAQKEQAQARAWNRTWNACCKKALEKDANLTFCSKCGTRLNFEDICHGNVVDTFSRLESATLDDFGDGWEFFQQRGWNVPSFDAGPGQMAYVTDFRPVISGMEDEDARSSNNEIIMSSIGEAPLIVRKSEKFDYSVLPSTFVDMEKDAREKEDEDLDEDEDFDPSLSNNPSDYIFALGIDPDSTPPVYIATITPEAYFIKEGYVYDQHMPIGPKGWACLQEADYECTFTNDPAQMHANLVGQGFRWDAALTKLLGGASHNQMWTPSVPVATSSSATNNSAFQIFGAPCVHIPPQQPSAKVSTDDCKVFIVHLVTMNNQLINAAIEPSPKAWSRESKKRTYNKTNMRVFIGGMLGGKVLRAWVEDDGNQIISVNIKWT